MGEKHDNRISHSLDRYIAQTLEIRSLSSPRAADIRGTEDYRTTLLRNFTRIGTLAADNNDILQTHWFPLIRREGPLTDEEAGSLEGFAASLLDAYKMENIDLTMRYMQTNRLLKDADNLDRVRLGDLKTRFLRHEGAKAVEPFAWRLIELEKTI